MTTITTVKNLFASVNSKFTTPVKLSESFIDEHYAAAVSDQNTRAEERAARLVVLQKRRTYFKYFNVRQRYGLTFKNFNRAVDNGVWKDYVSAE
jgi:hypothetical protein